MTSRNRRKIEPVVFLATQVHFPIMHDLVLAHPQPLPTRYAHMANASGVCQSSTVVLRDYEVPKYRTSAATDPIATRGHNHADTPFQPGFL